MKLLEGYIVLGVCVYDLLLLLCMVKDHSRNNNLKP